MKQLDEVLRNEVQKSVAEQQGMSNGTTEAAALALAVLITVVVVVPLTLLNLRIPSASRWTRHSAGQGHCRWGSVAVHPHGRAR